jgi:MoaA/NifB/PqqE/SkfB family radical SAM enzyme
MIQKKITPTTLAIDPCTRCQLKCPECPNTGTGKEPKRGWGQLKFENFKMLLDNNPYINTVIFDCFGELFLNKELLSMVKYGHRKGIILNLGSSNMNFVHKGVLEGIVKNKVNSLTIALDGATPEIYSIYRKGGNFNRVIDNIKEINRIKIKYDSPYPKLIWQFVVFGHNEHEIPMARAMAKELDMEFTPKMSWDSEFSPIKDKKFVAKQLGWSTTDREAYSEKEGQHYMSSICRQLWHAPRINWDGRVLGCCWTDIGFGANAFLDGYQQAINSDKIQYARNMLTGKVNSRKDIICTDCDIYKSMQTHGEFIKSSEVEMPMWMYLAGLIYNKSGIKKGLQYLNRFLIRKQSL